MVVLLLLAGCGANDEDVGKIGYVEGFFGAVAADEPRAALIGRDVLTAGGTAADAAVAMAFTASVTLPSSASLGGGGVCLGFDAESGQVVAVDFTARAPAVTPADADRPAGTPGFVRGMFAFHARFGRLAWSQVLAPAEKFARFGFRVSRALANDLREMERPLLADDEVRRIFLSGRGDHIVGEGELLTQVELAAVLGRIRSGGAGAFYTGGFPHTFADAATAAGGGLSVEDVRNTRPVIIPTITLPVGNNVAHFAAPPAAGGAVAAQIWAMLEDDFPGASPQGRLALLAEAGHATAVDRDRWEQLDGASSVPAQDLVAPSRLAQLMNNGRATLASAGTTSPRVENPAAASFVAADREGSAAVCIVTLNGLFGTGRIAPGTGVFLAAAPGAGGRGAAALGPMLIINQNVNEFYFAGAAAGGIAAPSALAGVALRTMRGGEPLEKAVRDGRVLGTRVNGLVYYEDVSAPAREAAVGLGTRAIGLPEIGRVNAISCLGGIPPNPETCQVATDPRGAGLSASAD